MSGMVSLMRLKFKLYPEAGMRRSQLCEEENNPERGNSVCQGPEPGKMLMCWRK